MSAAPAKIPVQSPLTCILPLRKGVDIKHLKEQLVAVKPRVDQALDKVSTVHFARFVLLQNDTQLAIITEYDGDFDRYIEDFAEHLHDVFDLLFKEYVADPPPVSVKDHAKELAAWVKRHDAPSIAFYSAYPTKAVVKIEPKGGK